MLVHVNGKENGVIPLYMNIKTWLAFKTQISPFILFGYTKQGTIKAI